MDAALHGEAQEVLPGYVPAVCCMIPRFSSATPGPVSELFLLHLKSGN